MTSGLPLESLRRVGKPNPPTLETVMFVRNCWYAAASDHEVLADTLLVHAVIGYPCWSTASSPMRSR